MDAETVESLYLERARSQIAARVTEIDLVLPDRSPLPAECRVALAGWWVDEASAGDRVLLPNPYHTVEAIAAMEAWVWRVVERLAPRLGERLDAAAGREQRPAAYWRMLLAPWLVHLVSALADRRLFCRAVAELLPGVPLAVPGAPEPPATAAESLRRLRTDEGNRGLLATIAPRLGVRVAQATPRRSASAPAEPRSHGRAVLGHASALPRAALSGTLSALPRRRTGLVGVTRLTALDLVQLEARVHGLTPLPRLARSGMAPSDPPPADPGARARLALPNDGDPLERLAAGAMPELLPRSLLEDFDRVQRESSRRYGEPMDVLVGSYGIDEIQNEYLARCRAAGRRLVFAQHGGMYLQSPVNAQERLELEPGATFLSWGGRVNGAVPTPNPYLERIRGSYRGGTRITLVEALEPPDAYVVRFAGHPLANQGYEIARTLADFVMRLPPSRRPHLALKRFPNVLGPQSRPAALEALPADGPSGGAAAWMATSRLAVIPYLDTPFIESMVIGTPTVGLWNPARWPLLEELEPLFEGMRRTGIVHHDPGSAAEHVDAIYDDAETWWSRPKVAEVRAGFIERFAVEGDGLGAWTEMLRALRRPR